MSLRRLFRYLANDEIVEQLSNMPIIRRGAQLTHYIYQKGMNKLNDAANVGQMSKDPGAKQGTFLTSFSRTFLRNLQKEIEKEMKR